jgi:hypothetical protein
MVARQSYSTINGMYGQVPDGKRKTWMDNMVCANVNGAPWHRLLVLFPARPMRGR